MLHKCLLTQVIQTTAILGGVCLFLQWRYGSENWSTDLLSAITVWDLASPGIEHQGSNQYEATHCSLYIEKSYASVLPNRVCALQVTPLVRSALEHLKKFVPSSPYSEEQTRLIRVIYDQLKLSNSIESFLPSTEDAMLSRVLNYIENNLDQDIPIKTLAAHVYVTERTLMRKSNKELGMSLTEWKQKLKVLQAMDRLELGDSIETIALELGYSSSSAFISMFKRIMGVTPKEYVKMNV